LISSIRERLQKSASGHPDRGNKYDPAECLGNTSRRLPDPETDITALYRQMVFNGFIGNTDDHLKNFIMLGGGENICRSCERY